METIAKFNIFVNINKRQKCPKYETEWQNGSKRMF